MTIAIIVLESQPRAGTLCSCTWGTGTCSAAQEPTKVAQTPGTMEPSAEPEGRGEAPAGPFHPPAPPACVLYPRHLQGPCLPFLDLAFVLALPLSLAGPFPDCSPLWESPGSTLGFQFAGQWFSAVTPTSAMSASPVNMWDLQGASPCSIC